LILITDTQNSADTSLVQSGTDVCCVTLTSLIVMRMIMLDVVIALVVLCF